MSIVNGVNVTTGIAVSIVNGMVHGGYYSEYVNGMNLMTCTTVSNVNRVNVTASITVSNVNGMTITVGITVNIMNGMTITVGITVRMLME